MSIAGPHPDSRQPSSMIVVVPDKNQSIMVTSILIMAILVILTVGLLMWILISGRAVTSQEHDSLLLRSQDVVPTSENQVPPAAPQTPAPAPTAPWWRRRQAPKAAETRQGEATTVSLLRPRDAAATTMRAWRTITAVTCRYADPVRDTVTGRISGMAIWSYPQPKSVPANTWSMLTPT